MGSSLSEFRAWIKGHFTKLWLMETQIKVYIEEHAHHFLLETNKLLFIEILHQVFCKFEEFGN